MSPEQAALLYAESVTRDPFLTEAEQAMASGQVREAEPPTRELPYPGPTHSPTRPKAPAPLHDTRNIILGSHGSFEHNGRHYEEGDVIEGTGWVVESVSESGAKVRSKDGLWRSFVRFLRQAAPAFEFQ